jgi:hypothetical protein
VAKLIFGKTDLGCLESSEEKRRRSRGPDPLDLPKERLLSSAWETNRRRH